MRVGKNVFAVIQGKLLAKCKDPGMFTIPCTIGNTQLAVLIFMYSDQKHKSLAIVGAN